MARPGQRKVTVLDVARAAGVGKSTVSNVLNGSGRVGEAARARVLNAADQLGYHPHQGARSMRIQRTMQLGYLMAPNQWQELKPLMMHFLQALVKAAADRSYGVLVIAQKPDPSEDIRRLTSSRGVDAFVLSDMEYRDRRAELLHALGMPFACMGRTGPGLPQTWVDIDNAEAEAEAVRHVLDRGSTRPAYVGYASNVYWHTEREAGFRAALASRGIPGEGAGLIRVNDDASGRARIRRFLAAAQPDAVLAGNDELAVAVYGAAADLGLVVGRDLAVVGFEGYINGDWLSPTLTSIVIPVDDIAARVVDRALHQVEEGEDTGPGEIVPALIRLGRSIPPHR